jgi:hypothetical protein
MVLEKNQLINLLLSINLKSKLIASAFWLLPSSIG